MTVEPGQDDNLGTVPDSPPSRRKVSVPFRRGDGIWSSDEHVRVDLENAAQWDDRRWRDRP